MLDPSFPLQQTLVAALKNHVGGAGDRVYDSVPPNAKYPYVSLGDCQVLPDKSDCIDGVEVYPQIDVWSQAKGYEESKTIAAAVLLALDDQPIVVQGFNVVVFQVDAVHYLRDPDGLTRHAAITFRGILTPA